MKFVKLLSLYKHLHTQHSDILPNTEEEKLTCVVCDFRAPSHNSLLVHMRKHNNQDAIEENEEPGKIMLFIQGVCRCWQVCIIYIYMCTCRVYRHAVRVRAVQVHEQ